jgi:hypothetical protein
MSMRRRSRALAASRRLRSSDSGKFLLLAAAADVCFDLPLFLLLFIVTNDSGDVFGLSKSLFVKSTGWLVGDEKLGDFFMEKFGDFSL